MEEKLYCANCGCEIENGEEKEIRNNVYCAECYDNLVVCDFCGKMIPVDETHATYDGDVVCQRCFEDDCFVCDCCGEIFDVDREILINADDIMVCESCAERNYYHCRDCGGYFENTDGTFLNDGNFVCDECINTGYYGTCEDCQELFDSEDLTYCENDDCYYCPDCISEHESRIISAYHDHDNDLQFFGNNENNSVPYLGVELEIDNGDDNDKCAEYTKDQFPDNFIYFEYDGSLDNGFENITQPATMEYHYSLKEDYQKAFKNMVQSGFRSHDTNTCGLHVHFNRDFFGENEDLCITRLLYLVEKFWNELTKFSRRSIDKLDRWAKKYEETPETVLDNMKNRRLDRYRAVNLTNYDTIEFRLFRGTLNIITFIATLQLCNELILTAKNVENNLDLQNLKWDDLLKTDELKTYWETVKNRG